jgi:TonB family protein
MSGSKLDDSFELVQMAPLMKAMDECVADLRRHWNIEPTLRSKLRTPATTKLVPLFSTNDYPGISVRKGESGTVGVVLLIDEGGKVADCMVTETSGHAALDTQTCAVVMRRAKYTPAIGEDGKPAKGADTARIRWVMP